MSSKHIDAGSRRKLMEWGLPPPIQTTMARELGIGVGMAQRAVVAPPAEELSLCRRIARESKMDDFGRHRSEVGRPRNPRHD